MMRLIFDAVAGIAKGLPVDMVTRWIRSGSRGEPIRLRSAPLPGQAMEFARTIRWNCWNRDPDRYRAERTGENHITKVPPKRITAPTIRVGCRPSEVPSQPPSAAPNGAMQKIRKRRAEVTRPNR